MKRERPYFTGYFQLEIPGYASHGHDFSLDLGTTIAYELDRWDLQGSFGHNNLCISGIHIYTGRGDSRIKNPVLHPLDIGFEIDGRKR